MDGNVLPVVESVRDLGITVSPDLDFGIHAAALARWAHLLVECIYRCFIVRNPEFHLKLSTVLVISESRYHFFTFLYVFRLMASF